MSDIIEKTSSFSKLHQKIISKECVVAVFGLGYVGMPLLLTMGQKKIKTIGFDVSEKKVNAFNHTESFLKDLDIHALENLQKQDLTYATLNPKDIQKADIIVMCVPTPLTRNLDPDMGYIESATQTIADNLQKGQLIILESTTFPGTSEEIVTPILEKTGMISGQDFFVAYSPEREDPGNKKFDTGSTAKIVGADTEQALRLATEFYDIFIDNTVPVTSTKVAESAKLMENIFRAVNIGLVNELKTVFSEMGIDIWDVIEAAKTKPFGFMPFYPGPGIGGHCIPIDPLYLTWKSNEYKIETRFIRLATEINQSMPKYVTNGLAEALNDRFAKSLNGANILIIGLAYKKNVDDARESPSADLVRLLKQRKANISYYDPYVATNTLEEYEDISAMDLTPHTLDHIDAAVIMTDHDHIDWDFIVQNTKLVIDTRNATKNISVSRDNIVKL